MLLELGDRLCTRTLPKAEAHWLQTLHAGRGVDIRLRTSLLRLEGDGAARRAELSDGSHLEVGAVVAGIGIAPNLALAAQCGVLVRSGIVVDGHGRTSVPRVYAAGDVTERHCAWHDASVRLETWDNANRQGEAAASHIASLLRSVEPAASAAAAMSPPWFWSDQYGVNLQVVGAPLHGDTVPASEDATRRLAIHLRQDVVVGAIGINRPRDVRRLRKLLGEGVPVTRSALQQQGIVG